MLCSHFVSLSLSVSLSLYQPAFALADTHRALIARRLLTQLAEDSRLSKQRLSLCQERAQVLTHEIQLIETRLQQLTEELRKKQSVVALAQREYEECTERIKVNEEKKIGLCIR